MTKTTEQKTSKEIYEQIHHHTFPYCGCKSMLEHNKEVKEFNQKKWFSEQELKDKLKAEYQKGIKDGAEGIKAQLEMWKISKLKKAEMQWLR